MYYDVPWKFHVRDSEGPRTRCVQPPSQPLPGAAGRQGLQHAPPRAAWVAGAHRPSRLVHCVEPPPACIGRVTGCTSDIGAAGARDAWLAVQSRGARVPRRSSGASDSAVGQAC